MRSPNFSFRLMVVLSLASVCNLAQAAPPSPRAPQQQAPAKTAPAPDAAEPTPPADDDALSLSDQIIEDVLEPLRTGMQTQNIKQVMSVFDKSQMPNYGDLQQQISAFLRQYQEVRFRYQILQATAQNDRASATAELDMDALPYQATMIEARRSVQMRFQLKQESKAWRVVAFSPSDFFTLSNYSRTDTQ